MAKDKTVLQEDIARIMGQPFEVLDRDTKVKIAYIFLQSYRDELYAEIVAEYKKENPKDKNDFADQLSEDYEFLTFERQNPERVVLNYCARLGIVIPDDPVPDAPFPLS